MKFPHPAFLAAFLIATPPVPAMAQFGADTASDPTYQQQQNAYDQAMRDYKAALAQYQRDRADYDQQNAGARGRSKIALPPSPPEAPEPLRIDAPPPYVSASCERRWRDDQTVLDKAAAPALGGPPDPRAKPVTTTAMLGAAVSGTLGANIASSATTAERYAAECDSDGFYYESDQTFAYREQNTARVRNGRYDARYYQQENCRLAIAAVQARGSDVEYRYARVCPDRRGRLRFTG